MAEQLPPGPSAELWRKAEEDDQYWDGRYPELRAMYPDQLVATRGREIVATGADLFDIARELEAKGIDQRDVRVRFISAKPLDVIL